MCFELSDCFGGGSRRREDFGRRERDSFAPSKPLPPRRGRQQQRYQDDEAGRKAYHDAYPPQEQDKVGAGYTTYAARLRELAAAPDHRGQYPMDFHHYPTTSTNTLQRYD